MIKTKLKNTGLVIAILLMCFTTTVSAYSYSADGEGTFEHSVYNVYNHNSPTYLNNAGFTLYYVVQGYVIDIRTAASIGSRICLTNPSAYQNIPGMYYTGDSCFYSGVLTNSRQMTMQSFAHSSKIASRRFTITISSSPITEYQISGNTCGITDMQLYINTSDGFEKINYTTLTSAGDSYTFHIFSGCEYSLKSSDNAYYNFTCSGDINYDRDICTFMTITLKDYCGNKMQNTSVDIYKSDGGSPASYEFVDNYHRINPISLNVDDIGVGKMLDIYFDTDMGTYHQVEYCIEQNIDMLHPFKWWAISYGAFDDITHNPIENIKMHVNQSCKPEPDRLLSTYAFTGSDGYALFTGLSAQKVYVRMDNDQYTGDRFWVDGLGDAFHTYHVIDTYLNLSDEIDDWHNNTDNMSVGCNIHFKDQSGHIDNHINDTDTYVDLYYDNGNCSATLKFQRLYNTYWMTKTAWNIPINESGYKRVYNVNFSDYDANYRGYMYATECECNVTLSLYVTNETVQEEQHYENLSTYIRFNHQLGGNQVDYRSPVEIKAYAYTNTSAYLLNINLTLYEQTSQIATIALNWADFAGATPKWYYVWQPTVNYDIGKNYTVVMTGYNDLNLGADDVWTSNIRNNKLTIYVKDNHNSPIDYATVFIEGWGSQTLGSSTHAEIEGFDNGNVQYKASKSGYTSSSWATVTMNDADESVTCILVKESSTRVTGYKLRNDEIKDFFVPIMYLLLMFMLLGAFIHVSGRK